MRISITTAALLAQILLGQSLAARVVINAQDQLQTLEQGTPTIRNLEARQVPVSNPNDAPRDAAPGGATAPKDMQPKPNEVMPQPTPVIPGSTSTPKMPVPVPNPGPVKPPVSGRVRRSSVNMKRKRLAYAQQPAPGAPGSGENDPVLPKIIPQPKVPGIPQPKVPVPVETDRPVPMTFAR